MEAAEALADLKQISTQIDRAVIVTLATGAIEGSTLADAARSDAIARAGTALWQRAERARGELGRPQLVQLEVATPDGSVFAVADPDRLIVAVTAVDPTVGLVFYDLKSCLRNLLDDLVDDEPETDESGAGEPAADAATSGGEPQEDNDGAS